VPARACFGVLAFFLFSLPAVAHAEHASSAPAARCQDLSIATYVFGGTSGWDARALDARLASLGYSTFEQNPGSGGLGLRMWSDECSFTGAMELEVAMANANADAGRELSLVSGQLMFHVGRLLYASRNVRSYAMLGLGYGANMLSLDPWPSARAAMRRRTPSIFRSSPRTAASCTSSSARPRRVIDGGSRAAGHGAK
jgi:hypothetical protein